MAICCVLQIKGGFLIASMVSLWQCPSNWTLLLETRYAARDWYEYKLMMENRNIRVLAYNTATVLSEKLETVISRADQNTRPRDYYDIYILTKL